MSHFTVHCEFKFTFGKDKRNLNVALTPECQSELQNENIHALTHQPAREQMQQHRLHPPLYYCNGLYWQQADLRHFVQIKHLLSFLPPDPPWDTTPPSPPLLVSPYVTQHHTFTSSLSRIFCPPPVLPCCFFMSHFCCFLFPVQACNGILVTFGYLALWRMYVTHTAR